MGHPPIRLALALAALPLGAAAQMLPGADDPAYRSAMVAALAADDPRAMGDLHRLAEDGNAAATVALATVSGWYDVGTTLAERRVFRTVNGVPVAQAAAALHPPSAWWTGRNAAVTADIYAHAEGLFAADEPRKGARVLEIWLNLTGARGDVPPGFWTGPHALPWTRAQGLASRLATQPETAATDLAMLAGWIAKDRPEGWIVLEKVEQADPASATGPLPELMRAAILAQVAARDPATVAARRSAAAALRDLTAGASPDEVDPGAMDGVAVVLSQAGADLPMRLWCTAACPGDPGACTRAAVAAFGVRPSLVDDTAPMVAVWPLSDFYASPRGRYQVVTAGFMAHRAAAGDPEAIETALRGPALTRAVAMDACFGGAVRDALPDLVTRRFVR
jgi:hypothetical protein